MFEQFGVFYRGLLLGLMISAPVGPIGLLCIRRTIQKGLLIGFATGMGAACADTLFATISALGITAILEFMRHYDAAIRLIGGGVLFWGAWHTWNDKPEPPPSLISIARRVVGTAQDENLMGTLKAFLSGVAITLTNPVTIFAVLAVVAAFGNLQSRLDAGTLVGGVFFGAALWWIILSGGIALVRHHFTEGRIVWINRVTAAILAAIALGAIYSGGEHIIERLRA